MSDTPTAIVAGPDLYDLGDALKAEGVAVSRITDIVSTETLENAGIAEAALLVFTDTAEATGIPVAKENYPDVRVVVYADESLPEFVKGQADLAVDPALLDASIVAEELVGSL
ncbi:DUF7126 family protein [Natronocalculus amylovorans]|uniref:CTP synthetase n=1 Tax=Natronocalculus amylovorans TaxID=2917812 RepID=A0AAE3K9U8_9EURY|nr:CTP synthetase [Natronocalculus amylovorans]MCL9816419.1 CTP synthetase [Natronocalculus amylovorans]NUE03511.1 CTP synthetase [Halorubraceae archaeon YAN]